MITRAIVILSVFAALSATAEQYWSDSAEFLLEGADAAGTFVAESVSFAINYAAPDVFGAESSSFNLMGLQIVPEPVSMLALAAVAILVRRRTTMRQRGTVNTVNTVQADTSKED